MSSDLKTAAIQGRPKSANGISVLYRTITPATYTNGCAYVKKKMLLDTVKGLPSSGNIVTTLEKQEISFMSQKRFSGLP